MDCMIWAHKEKAMLFLDARNLIEGQKSFRKLGGRSNFGYPQIINYFNEQFHVIRAIIMMVHPIKTSYQKGVENFLK